MLARHPYTFHACPHGSVCRGCRVCGFRVWGSGGPGELMDAPGLQGSEFQGPLGACGSSWGALMLLVLKQVRCVCTPVIDIPVRIHTCM
jgi:hypothetical protein